MKKHIKLLSLLAFVAGAFSLSALPKEDKVIETQAAATNTKRVWFYPDYVDWWASDLANAPLGIHYWGGSHSTTWPGARMLKDDANNLWYYDVPSDTTDVIFTRINNSKPTEHYNQSKTFPLENYANTYRCELWNNQDGYGHQDGAWVATGTHWNLVTTTKVSNLADSIATKALACSDTKAQQAVNTYNSFSTFEQNQFNELNVGGGVTGLQRLNYLKSFYNITTPLLTSDRKMNNKESDKTALAITIGLLGVSTFAGYYLVNRKKEVVK